MRITVDVTARNLKKKAEYLCGDTTEMLKTDQSDVIILADGMGSGVRASILSTLTAKLLGTMFAGGSALEDCVEAMVQTLPLEKTRGVAYSTFSILQIFQDGSVYLIEYDNPGCIWIHNGRKREIPVQRRVVRDRKIKESRFQVEKGDILFLISDGVTHAGAGQSGDFAFGWSWERVSDYAETLAGTGGSSVRMADEFLGRCRDIWKSAPRDDTTVVVARMIGSETVNLLTGPPADEEMDAAMVADFMADGKAVKIISGGTSATIVSRETGKPLQVSLEYADPDIPPVAKMDGVDLVTEGILTLRRAVELLEIFADRQVPPETFFQELDRKNGASALARILIEHCTDLHLFVGTAVNHAYQNPDLPVDLGIRQALVKRLTEAVRRMDKRVTVQYY